MLTSNVTVQGWRFAQQIEGGLQLFLLDPQGMVAKRYIPMDGALMPQILVEPFWSAEDMREKGVCNGCLMEAFHFFLYDQADTDFMSRLLLIGLGLTSVA